MGLFSSIGDYLTNQPSDTQTSAPAPATNNLANYNDEVASSKIARRRAIADMLTKQAAQTQQGQFFKSGDFTGYAGGETLGSALMRGVQAYLGTKMNGQADEAQQQQGQDRANALATRLGIMNGDLDAQGNPVQSPQDTANGAALNTAVQLNQAGDVPKVGMRSKDAANALMASIAGDAPQLADTSNMPAAPDSTMGAPTASAGSPPPAAAGFSPRASAPVTQSKINAAMAAQALGLPPTGAGAGRGAQGGPNAMQMDTAPGTPSANARLAAYALNKVPGSAFDSPNPNTASAALAPVQQPDAVVIGGPKYSPAPLGAPSPAPANAPAMPQNAPTSVQTPMLGAQVAGQAANPAQMPAPNAGPAVDPSMAKMNVPSLQGPGFATPQQVAAATPAPRTPAQMQADSIVNLAKLAQTGPQGAAIAQGIQADMFSKNGRYTTTVDADRVNGGFVKTTTDTRTGQSVTTPIGNTVGAHGIGTPSVDADGNRILVYKDGSSSIVRDQNGAPVKDAGTLKSNDEQKMKVGSAVVSNESARSSVSSSLARLDRIEQLYKETETGPVAGHLPNWTAKRQELQALLAQDIFAETRDAVAGAADAGGAPKMTQREFEFMKDNGGLSMTTKPEAATNIISQQRLRLNALNSTLASHAKTLEGVTAPSTTSTQAVPGRGQTTTAASRGF